MDLSWWALWLSWCCDPKGMYSDRFLCLKAPTISLEVVKDGFLNHFSTDATCYTVRRSMSFSVSDQAGWWGRQYCLPWSKTGTEWTYLSNEVVICAEGDSWCAVSLCLFFFTTTIQIFASVLQPKLLSNWHIWSVTLYHIMHGTKTRCLAVSQNPALLHQGRERRQGPQGFPGYKRGREEVKHIKES